MSSDLDPTDDGGGIRGLAGFNYISSNNPEIFIPSDYNSGGILGALTPSNNDIQWSFKTPGNLIGSVAVIPGAVLFGDTDGNMYVFSTSGEQLFAQALPSGIYGGITVAEGYVFVPTAYGSVNGVYAFAPSNTNLKVDGAGNCSNGVSSQCQIKLGTSTPNDLIIVQESSVNGHITARPTDTAGLVYSLRTSADAGNGNVYTSVWTAEWTGSGTDTVTCSGDNGNARIGCIAFAVSGANLTSPFDNNPSVPCSASSTSSSPSCTLSTNHPEVLILGFVNYGCGVTPTPDSGFTFVQSFTACNADSAVEYKVVSSTQADLSIGLTLSASTEWVMIGEAVVGAT
jgi:hypothetical protein